MHIRSSLLCGAALGVLLAAGIGGSAQAAPKRTTAAATADQTAKIDSLTEAVGTLEQRLNDVNGRLQATEQRAEAAEARAEQAEASAQAAQTQLQTQIQTIPAQIQSESARNRVKTGWAENTSIGATVFTDLSNINQTDVPGKINPSGTGADIKRAYLTINHNFSPIYSANLTIDFAPNGTILGGGTYGTGTLQGSEAIKYAYIQAAYDPRFIIKFGAAQMPWIPFVEDTYAYRFVEKVPVDYNKVGNSSDWGVNLHGDFGKGLFDYSVSVVDGAGYKNPVRSHDMDIEGRVNVNYMGFIGALGGYSGQLATNFQGTTAPTQQTASRWDVLVAYVNPMFRVGFEYFQAQNWKVLNSTAAPVLVTSRDTQEGYSVWGAWNFYPQWSLFGRYDWGNPSEDLAPRATLQYYNIGINYEPVKTLDIALVYKHDQLDNAIARCFTASASCAGSPLTTTFSYADGNTTLIPQVKGGSAHYDEIGIFTQFKF